MRTRHSFIRILAATFVVSAVGVSAYELNGPKWGTHQVPYYINPANADMSEDAAVAAIQAGAMAWAAQSNANILPYYMGRTSGSTVGLNGKSEIFFRNSSAGGMYGDTTWWYNGSYRLIEADIVFYDGGVSFFSSSGGCSGGIYLEDATTHEFGHALGLGHSSNPSASMYHTMLWCTSDLRTLHSDDLAGIEALYPSVGGNGNTAPSVTITTPATGTTFTQGTSVTFAGSASDGEDGSISNRLVWMSSIDGQIGTGGSFTRVLSVGSHVVMASASDNGGLTATKQIIVSITSLPSTPTPETPPSPEPPAPPPPAPPPPSSPPAPAPAPGPSPASPSSCTTPDPFGALGGGVCCNGGWLPLGMSCATPTFAPTPTPTPAPTPAPTTSICATPNPFAALGGGTCCNGGWLPPGMTCAAPAAQQSVAPAPPPVSTIGCAGPDPFVAIGGGACVNGGWVPRSLVGG